MRSKEKDLERREKSLNNIQQTMNNRHEQIIRLNKELKGTNLYKISHSEPKSHYILAISAQEELMATQKQIEKFLQDQVSNQAKVLEENKTLEQAQAAQMRELEAKLTAKDEELGKVLKAAKDAHVEKDRAVKEAHNASIRALNKKEEEIKGLLKENEKRSSKVASAKKRFLDIKLWHGRKSQSFIPFHTNYNACI